MTETTTLAAGKGTLQPLVGRGIPCVRCGKRVEKARECYALPTCYACLPPPEPLEMINAPNIGLSAGWYMLNTE